MIYHKKNLGGFTPTPTWVSLQGFFKSIVVQTVRRKNMKRNISNSSAVKTRPMLVSGFTMVEMIVSIGLFTIVLFIASSAFLTVLNADRKSRATRIATDNLNLSLEDMSRRIKTGTTYNCGVGSVVPDCVSPGRDSIAFTDQDGTRTTYRLKTDISGKKFIERLRGISVLRVTAPEIEIINLQFVVGGTAVGPSLGGNDVEQPYVIILVEGKTNIGTITSNFKIQTMVTQRAYDI